MVAARKVSKDVRQFLVLLAIIACGTVWIMQSGSQSYLSYPASSAQPPDKVAVMFLTRGRMPHEGLWGAWLRAANGLIPGERQEYGPLADQALCNSNVQGDPFLHDIQRPGKGSRSLPCQCLFSFYIHPPPGFKDYPPDSVFHGREVPNVDRIQVEWGKHTMVLALRALLRVALSDPANASFQLLCESSIPLYHPTLIYREIMRSPIDHVNTCPPKPGQYPMTRANWDLYKGLDLNDTSWRKNTQFACLKREHAELALREKHVERTFAKLCFDKKLNTTISCNSEEFFLGTMLTHAGLSTAPNCSWTIVAEDWGAGGFHPRHFEAKDATLEMVQFIRTLWNSCRDRGPATRSARASFVKQGELGVVPATAYAPVILRPDWSDGYCPMWARKFVAATAGPLRKALTKDLEL